MAMNRIMTMAEKEIRDYVQKQMERENGGKTFYLQRNRKNRFWNMRL